MCICDFARSELLDPPALIHKSLGSAHGDNAVVNYDVKKVGKLGVAAAVWRQSFPIEARQMTEM